MRTGVAVVAVVVFLAVSTGVVLPAGAGAGDDGRGLHQVAAIHQGEDGTWWVLERPEAGFGEGPAVVYEHDAWDRTGTSHELAAAGNGSENAAVDVARVPGGGWYVLDRNGVVYRYTDDWEYTGDSRDLSRFPDWEGDARARGLTRTPGGTWLVAAGGSTVRYGPEFRTTLGNTTRVRTGRGTFDGDALVVVPGSVHRYVYDGAGVGVDEGGSRIDPLPGPPRYPVDVARADGGGWWVATADGSVVRYDERWIHTGTRHAVGSGNAVGETPSDVIDPVDILVSGAVQLLVGLVPALGALAGGVLLAAYRGIRGDVVVGVVASTGYAYALLYQPYPLRPAFVWGGELSVLVAVVGLSLPLGHALGVDDVSVDAILPYTPVALASAVILVRILPGA